ncbi:MAG TPA: type II secretion system protein [Candidatus Moranbacteria bacterium]|nr:type II secretion system protein [Candidatus Moranbacteria bacterium]
MKMKKRQSVREKQKRGFTLIEMLLSIFIFSVLMLTVAGIFGNAIAAYKYAKGTQRSLEEAQFAMNRIAKTLRTATVKSSGSAKAVEVYNYSEGKCVRYEITSAGEVTEKKVSPPADFDPVTGSCPSFSAVPATVLAKNLLYAETMFSVQVSAPQSAGRIGMIFTVKRGTEKPVSLQTSVSLRDYEVSGLL